MPKPWFLQLREIIDSELIDPAALEMKYVVDEKRIDSLYESICILFNDVLEKRQAVLNNTPELDDEDIVVPEGAELRLIYNSATGKNDKYFIMKEVDPDGNIIEVKTPVNPIPIPPSIADAIEVFSEISKNGPPKENIKLDISERLME